MRGARSRGAGVLLVLLWAAGLTACGYEEGQPYGHVKAKQEWLSPSATERGDALRERLQVTQSDH